jgi:hypothetical protein
MSPPEIREPADDEVNFGHPSIVTPDRQRFKRAISVILILLGLQMFGVRLMHLPLSRVIELRYCQEYYNIHDPSLIDHNGNIAEQLCKVDTIQQQLAWLQGVLDILHSLCGASKSNSISEIRSACLECSARFPNATYSG